MKSDILLGSDFLSAHRVLPAEDAQPPSPQ